MSRARVIDAIRAGRRFLVTCHRLPDADALGSALGLAAVIRATGRDALVYVPDSVPAPLMFLRGAESVVRTLPPEPFDATFVMDTASESLLPRPFPSRDVSGPIVVIDHHAAHEPFGDLVYRDANACATGELVFKLMHDLGLDEVPSDAAMPIYAALVADTGGFRYHATRSDTLRAGAHLLDAGVDPWHVAYHLFENWPVERVRLLGAVLDTLHLHLDGRLAVLRVTRALLERVGANEGMVEGLVDYARALRGVQVAALLTEHVPAHPMDGELGPMTRINLRSPKEVDVSMIAVALGGGGHRAAAGATVRMDLETALARVVDETQRVLDVQ